MLGAIQEIIKLQKSTDLLLRKAPFMKLVREISQEFKTDVRWQGAAVAVIQEAAETYLVGMFSDAVYCMAHAKRVTLQAKDMQLVGYLRRETSPKP